MSNDFYDPILDQAGVIANEYGISISDVMTLLVQAGRDEAMVHRVLDQSAGSDDARAAKNAGRQFDLIEYARALLKSSKAS